MKKRKNSITAFSLVEVTIALAVVVFCLVTILGLLAVGINSTQASTVQTSATNILTAVASDLEADPNITPSYSPASAKGTVVPGTAATKFTAATSYTTPLYGILFPAGGAGATTYTKLYIGENGQTNATAAAALYQLNVWITANNTNTVPIHQETFVRLLLTWPASVTYTSAQGYVENIIAINRT
jgi:Tfp pilus assembly protein PilV